MQGRIRAAGLAFAIALIAAAPARAAVFTVTTNADTTPNPQSVCGISCSLRQALEASNVATDADTIVVPANTYALTNGALAVGSTRRVTITGAGAGTTIITAGRRSQVLTIAGEASASLSGLTLSDGNANSGSGGNILVGNTGALALDHVRVTNGVALNGGGIAATTAATVAISASLIDNNGSGGVYIDDGGAGTPTLIRDTTIAFNSAGGVNVAANTSPTQLQATTIAYNQGGGVIVGRAATAVSAGGSILAGNSPSNCPTALADAGANVETGTDCGLAGHQNTDPQLAAALTDGGGQTPVLPIPATSPAVNIVPTCFSLLDQRDVSRPQGDACDAGAYEALPPKQPPPVVTPTPTPTATPSPSPTPVPQKLVTGQVVDGKMLVRKPGAKTFVPFDPTQPIPLGSSVDARNGEIRISALLKPGGKIDSAIFFDGIFKITQTKTTTDLTLNEQLASCGKGAHAAAKKPKSRKLWGSGSGSFRTRGQYSSATVRGTEWLVQDSCEGTLTRVKHGVVTVHDDVRRKTIILRAGKKYLARPKKR